MSSPNFLLGIHNFKGRSEDELDISRGDYIEIIEDDSEFNDSWYFGRNLMNNTTGLFPKSFTTPVTALPPDVQALKDQFDLINAEEPTFSMTDSDPVNHNALPPTEQPTPNTNGTSYQNTPEFHKQFTSQNQLEHQYSDQMQFHHQQQQRQQQPNLSTLSIQDTPNTYPHAINGSDPNTGAPVEPVFNPPASRDPKKYIYPQETHQMSQASDIDAAISAMQDSPQQPNQQSSQQPSSNPVYQPPVNPQSGSQPNSRQASFSLSPPANTVLAWTPQQVESYFAMKGLVEDAPKFVKHRITGAILLEMDRETLKEIDIISFGPRFEIDKEIRNLRATVGISPVGSPQSPATPLSPSSYNGSMLPTSPMPNTSMNSIMNTPIASQNGYFTYPSQPGASVSTLSVHPSMPNLIPPNTAPQQPMMSPNYQTLPPQQSLPQQFPQQSHRVHTQQSLPNFNQGSSNTFRSVPRSQPPYSQQQTHSEPVPIAQQKGHQRTPSGGLNKLKNGSEEEITGSLTSNFSLKPNSTALAAAQAAGRGNHHRRSSSATSRYSMIANHQRTKTLEDWDTALPENEGTGSRRGHNRSLSRNSAFSSHRNTMPPQDFQVLNGAEQYRSSRSHSRNTSVDSKKQKRRSSVLSLLSGSPKKNSYNHSGSPAIGSPAIGSPNDNSNSSSFTKDTMGATNNSQNKRSSSDNTTFKSIMRPGLGKQKTSAFQEGIQAITAEKSAETAEKSGWMHKRGGSGIGVWSKRFFTLHGTRLSYFTTFKDTKERGLIDITGHRVVLVKDHELFVSLSAAGMGAGRHCFKLVPPGPGYKKGVAFTAPKVHYFAVDSAEEVRQWQSALMSATIERDESIPVESTCKLPTISLSKAQELMAERLKTKGDIGSLSK